jgi:hypothetical protein
VNPFDQLVDPLIEVAPRELYRLARRELLKCLGKLLRSRLLSSVMKDGNYHRIFPLEPGDHFTPDPVRGVVKSTIPG